MAKLPISFCFALAFPCNRMRKLRGLALPLVLWLGKLSRIGPIGIHRQLFLRAWQIVFIGFRYKYTVQETEYFMQNEKY